MNLTDTQKKIFAILFAAGEPLETDRLAEALAVSHAEAAEQCTLLQQALAGGELPLELRRLENSWQLCTLTGYDTVIRRRGSCAATPPFPMRRWRCWRWWRITSR